MARRPDLPAEITEQIEELDPKLMALKEAGELDKYFAGMEVPPIGYLAQDIITKDNVDNFYPAQW